MRCVCRAIEKGQAQLCILAEDCNQPDYKKLIEALCAEHNVNLISVPENKQLGQWCGVSAGAGGPGDGPLWVCGGHVCARGVGQECRQLRNWGVMKIW